MPIAEFLARLENVIERNGAGRADCSACGQVYRGKRALSFRITDSGALMIKCWRGHSAAEIVEAVGLDLSDLFPLRTALADRHHVRGPRRPFDAAAGVAALHDDLLLAGHLLVEAGDAVAPDRREFIFNLAGRCASIAEVCS